MLFYFLNIKVDPSHPSGTEVTLQEGKVFYDYSNFILYIGLDDSGTHGPEVTPQEGKVSLYCYNISKLLPMNYSY